MEYFRKHGFNDPASDPERAARLPAVSLSKGDEGLAPTMSAQYRPQSSSTRADMISLVHPSPYCSLNW